MKTLRTITLITMLIAMVWSTVAATATTVYAQDPPECIPTLKPCVIPWCAKCTSFRYWKRCTTGMIWNCYTYEECRLAQPYIDYACGPCDHCPQ